MRISAVLCFLFVGLCLSPQTSNAQEILQTIRDYCTDKPFQYSPCDPWTRSKIFNMQTGHAGLFYNCDGEEDKRNSPYICWKTHYESDIPPRRGLWRGLKLDVAQVRQRIQDGAGDCCRAGGQCARCATKHRTQVQGCQTCQGNAPGRSRQESWAAKTRPTFEQNEIQPTEISDVTKPLPVTELTSKRTPKYGLIRGNLLPADVQPAIENQARSMPEQSKTRYAKAIDQLFGKR